MANTVGFAHAASTQLDDTARSLFGDAPIETGRVTVKMPPIAENGYSVPIDISVESPMTADDHVTRIAIISERNPVATIAQFHLSPQSGLAHVSTRIRLAGTQDVLVVAEMNDGSLWSATTEIVVTLAACIIL
ncbi:MAG: thiosulfate oxidation carrier protein SoxY [Pseudomonadota bacterium]